MTSGTVLPPSCWPPASTSRSCRTRSGTATPGSRATSTRAVLPHVGKSGAEVTAKLVPLQRKVEQEEQARKAVETAKKAAKAKDKRKKKAKEAAKN